MVSFSAFALHLFFLIIGPSVADQAAFKQIKGQWEIVDQDFLGKPVGNQQMLPIAVEFAELDKSRKVEASTMVYTGNFDAKKQLVKMKLTDITAYFRSGKQDSNSAPQTMRLANQAHVLFEVKGDSMRLLLTQVVSKYDTIPTTITTKDHPHSTLWTLRRKVKPGSAK